MVGNGKKTAPNKSLLKKTIETKEYYVLAPTHCKIKPANCTTTRLGLEPPCHASVDQLTVDKYYLQETQTHMSAIEKDEQHGDP